MAQAFLSDCNLWATVCDQALAQRFTLDCVISLAHSLCCQAEAGNSVPTFIVRRPGGWMASDRNVPELMSATSALHAEGMEHCMLCLTPRL